ncbi:putative phosphoglycerate mutase [Hydrogenivirga caldilitoris]|uniref:Putative phosphoglycerate mutase n=1 Tax=Hydrogenivirga caldilitoris TaxID=246264 RepID=A0A497XPB9_9AQUI|nr:histidine phosphatase family protein [Hydrogenivirga caldilitoris]RLJ70144.1 putative phosphoglycerate mutase [Hydrogenivirga caldilitoris]
MKRIYLVRHAQSEFNEKGIFQGRLDSDLTPLGFVQARMVAMFLSKEGIQALISSPQRRAYKTALTIGDVLGLEPEIDERIREMSFGFLEGRNFWELFDQEREMMLGWLKNPVRNPLPTQEPMENFEKRILSFLEDLKKREEDNLVVVGHGGTLHGIVCLSLGLGLENLWSVHMDNTGVSLLEFDGEGFRLIYLNNLCHLV